MSWHLKLFTRIFLGFWLVTTAVLASWMLANHYFESRPGEVLDQRRPGPPKGFVLQTIYELQTVDRAALPGLIERIQRDHPLQLFLLDHRGGDLLQRAVPPPVRRAAEELRGSRRRAHLNADGAHLIAFQIYRPEDGALRAVFVFRPSAHQLLRLLGSHLWLRVGLAVLISGLLCFALSRLITRRLKALQGASRRLAGGDLDVRLQVRERGGDETDELARAFNSMARQLQERMDAQKRLLGDVSHELRSPLARLRIALALAQENPARTGRYLERIEAEAERLEELIQQLLTSQAPDIALDTRVDLVPLLEQLVADAGFEGQAENKRVVLEYDLPRAVVASAGDLLRKGLENILRNALAHTAPHTTVRVGLRQSTDCFEIEVADCGGGVAPGELENIFRAFYRTDTARSRESGGYGLGLAIARRAIEQHGGAVTAQNRNGGLLVTINLPADELPD